jgi:hypothetical protein
LLQSRGSNATLLFFLKRSNNLLQHLHLRRYQLLVGILKLDAFGHSNELSVNPIAIGGSEQIREKKKLNRTGPTRPE